MALRSDIATILNGQRPLFALARKGVSEIVVSGVNYVSVEEQPLRGDDPDVMLVARALLMPWQFLAMGIDDPEPFWALGLASHSGQPHHVEALRQLATAAGAGESQLVCPRVWPLDPGVSSMMQNAGVTPTRLHHPCAGKHLLMLAACARQNLPAGHYHDPDHAVQKRVAALVGQELNEKPIWLTDACGLPTIAASARALTAMWMRLLTSTEPRVVRLREFWVQNHRLIGGYGRLDADLMDGMRGSILVKEGGDGLLIVAAPRTASDPAALCLVKLASGYSATWLALAVWAALSGAPHLPPALVAAREWLAARLEKWVPPDMELILPPFSTQ